MELSEVVESLRIEASLRLSDDQKSKMGQFFTPVSIAKFMASMVSHSKDSVHILDPGAGVGSLFSSVVASLCQHDVKQIKVTCFEIDSMLAEYLHETMQLCEALCEQFNVKFSSDIITEDFLEYSAQRANDNLFRAETPGFDCVIVNPPYFKINTNSQSRRLIRELGVETTNIYTGFLIAATHLLQPEGELIAITPRSYCNGTYFQPFREFFLNQMVFRQIHLFHSRDQAFSDNSVLQENIIIRAVKSTKAGSVEITSNAGPTDEMISIRTVPHENIVDPDDTDKIVHIATDEMAAQVTSAFSKFKFSLSDLGINVSTGKVVEFRAKKHLRSEPEPGTIPLIYPTHFDSGRIVWPKKNSKKPNALVDSQETIKLQIPNDCYILVKRFSAKEERRRITAALYDGKEFSHKTVAIDGHLNYIHQNGNGLEKDVAKGLLAFLNSTIIDLYFRQFSGHTQVNATDLRYMKFPAKEKIVHLGRSFEILPEQDELDELIHQILFEETKENPINAMKKIQDAILILKSLGLPKQQINERSALTLLSLLDVKPDDSWSDATDPLCGITQMMDYFAEHYGKQYKPNSRETVRRQTIHQFRDAGMILSNPDDLERAINSPKTVYQIEPKLLSLLRQYGSDSWMKSLQSYLALSETLKKKYAQEREMKRIPIKIPKGMAITLSPGGQNVLVQKIIEDFCPIYTPDAKLIYVGDTDEKYAYFDEKALLSLGVKLETHGQIPDVIVYYTMKKWLVLIEAVTSHGPVNPKRHGELSRMFSSSNAGLVYVTTFLDRKTMAKYLGDISWETEVWIAEAPTHMIHFNGERFLGPY